MSVTLPEAPVVDIPLLDVPDGIPTIKECLDRLAALGTADKIADLLAESNIKGYQGNGFECAIARYIKREVSPGPEEHIGVGGMGVREIRELGDGFCQETLHRNPSAVSEFIRNFDDGRYPGLVEVPTRVQWQECFDAGKAFFAAEALIPIKVPVPVKPTLSDYSQAILDDYAAQPPVISVDEYAKAVLGS